MIYFGSYRKEQPISWKFLKMHTLALSLGLYSRTLCFIFNRKALVQLKIIDALHFSSKTIKFGF